MRRQLVTTAVLSALVLAGCSGDSSDEAQNKAPEIKPSSRVTFDPGAGVLPLPNDLLFLGTPDGTIQIPGEADAVAAFVAAKQAGTIPASAQFDYSDPQLALGALDGWSTTQPITLDIALDEGVTIDAVSVAQPGAVRVFEVVLGGALSPDSECAEAPSLSICKPVKELTWGPDGDFVTAVNGNSIAVVPVKPLKATTGYLYATTTLLQDSEGRSIDASETYKQLAFDISTKPLPEGSSRDLQALVNNYQGTLAQAFSVDPETLTYTGVFSTQSVFDAVGTVKQLIVSPDPAHAPFEPSMTVPPTYTGFSAAQLLQLTPVTDPTNPGFAAYAALDATMVFQGALSLPYYLRMPTAADPSINSTWSALGDSPLAVLQSLQAGTITLEKFSPQVVACGQDPLEVTTNPALLVGCTVNLDDGTMSDPTRNITRFNPVPAIKGYQTVPFIMTMPDTAKFAALGMTIEKPMTGWPLSIALHGLGATKESTLANSGSMSAAGLATIAIDMPLHGQRGFDFNGDGVLEVSATDPSFGAAYANGSPLVFINIDSGLTVRDNFRQAVVDHFGLQAAVAGMVMAEVGAGGAPSFDLSQMTMQGLSLGAIVGTDFTTHANMPIDGVPAEMNPFTLQASSLVAPAGGLAGVFAGSPSFRPLLIDNLVVVVAETQGVELPAVGTPEFEAFKQTPEYAAFVAVVESDVIPPLLFSIQTQVDSIDPVNHGAALAATGSNVHLIEVVGDGDTNLPDQVLPNTVEGAPLSGTEPLIASIGLGCVSSSTMAEDGVSGAVRFTKGHHSSLLNPSEIPGVTDGMSAALATAEMQTQVAAFAASNGAAISVSEDIGPLVLKSCE